MDYLKGELQRDIRNTNARYDTGVIDFDQRQIEFKGYISIVKNIDEEKAKELARNLGVDYSKIL